MAHLNVMRPQFSIPPALKLGIPTKSSFGSLECQECMSQGKVAKELVKHLRKNE
jgi:hypothetical protein